MGLRNFGFLAILLVLCTQAGELRAQIYKTVDAQGNVVFTDVPPKDDGKAVKIDAGNTYKPAVPAVPAAVPAPEEAIEEDTNETSYDQLNITSPTADEPVRENAGNLTVTVAASPALDTSSGHTVQILLDGNVFASGASGLITLENVDRGTHQLAAQIVDADGTPLITSELVEFHMLRVSVNQRKQRNAN